MAYYGVVFPEFWTGRTGRELRVHGKDAQLLALYLVTNRHTNMLGLYRLLIDDVRHETGLGFKAIDAGFRAMQVTEFGVFDAESSFVWVRSMARFRLNLKPGQPLDPDDNRVLAINRIYHAIDPNPFLAAFFDANHKILRLKKRREPVDLVVDGGDTTTSRASKGLTKGLVSQIQNQDQRSEAEIRDQKKARLAPPSVQRPDNDNPGAVRALIAALVRKAQPGDSFTDLKEDAKQACVDADLAYDAELVGSALEQALARKAKAS